MANRTVKDAHSVKGTNPQYLVEKIIRTRIYECKYWKEQCFALSAELLVDKAMELKYIGGIFGGNIKPTPFLCLVLKMLQIQPEKDIIVEFISQQAFKYVRALGAVYMRLVGTSLDCYKYLEPLYNDYRKIKRQNRDGNFEMLHMDELIDDLLREERCCDVILPRIQKRLVLEESNQLEPRISFLDEEMDDVEDEEEEEEGEMKEERPPTPEKKVTHREHEKTRRSPSPRARRSRSRSPKRRRGGGTEREKERHRDSDRHRGDRDRERRRSRSRERHRDRGERGHRHRHHEEEDRHRHHRSSKRSHRDKEKDRGREKEAGGGDHDAEIEEANALRASLGLAPLK